MTARAARIGLWLAALFVVVVLGSWMILPLFVSSELVRSAIERELADITGREISVGGRVDIDLFPSPVARLYDVHVLGDPGPAGNRPDDILIVETVEVAIPVSSLLARDPAFSQFRLIRPVLKVAIDTKSHVVTQAVGGRLGRALSGLKASSEETESSAAQVASDARGLHYVRFGTATIENGTIEFADPFAKEPEKITAINGVVSWPRAAQRLSASLKGIWRGAAVEQKLEIDDAIHFFAGEITGFRLALTSDAVKYTFDGKIGSAPTPFAEGSVSLDIASLSQALDWLQLGISPQSKIGKVALKGTVSGDSRKVRFENMALALDGSTGMGVLEFAFKENAKPAMSATLDFAQVDIVSFLSAFAGFPNTAEKLDEPISSAIMDQIDVDLRMSAATATAGRLQLSNIAAVTQIRNGSAVFELADATAYGGKAQAHLKIKRDTSPLGAEFGMSYTDVNSAAIADALAFGGLFPRGIASGNLNITSPLEKWSDLLKRATGTMQLRVVNGLINGVGFQTLGGSGEPKTFFRLQDNAQTSDVFTSMSVDGLIQEGVIIVNGGVIDYPAGAVQLNGVIPYGTASIAVTTIAEPRNGGDAAQMVQHFIGGSWSNPYATPILLPGAP
ncbi:MAG: AsmA-like C-terminal region-containing protein [Oricola sp.]